MGGSSKKQTVGYKYYLGAHIAICQGPVDNLSEIQVDRRQAWCGTASVENGDTLITIDAPQLFGGDGREGGIEGNVDLLWGSSNQQKNQYLMDKLGVDIPAFRGVFSVVLNQVYVGNNPYLKPWGFRVQRISTPLSGEVAWLEEYAECSYAVDFDCAGLFALVNAGNGDPDTVGAVLTQGATKPDFSLLIPAAFSNTSLGLYRVTGVEVTDWATDYDAIENPYVATMTGYTDCDGLIPGWCVDLSQTPGGGFDAGICDASYASINYSVHKMSAVVTPADGDGAMGMNRWFRRQIVGAVIGGRSAAFRNTLDQWVYSGRIGGASDQLGTRFTVFHQVLAGGSLQDSETVTFDVPYVVPGTAVYVQVTHSWDRTYSRAEYNAGASGFYDAYDCYLIMTTEVCVSISGENGGRYGITQSREYFAGTWDVVSGSPAPVGVADQSSGASIFTGFPTILNSGSVLLFAWTFGRYNAETATNIEGSDVPICDSFVAVSEDECGPCFDMNPAHIIRECLTNPDWGMGYNVDDVDDASFTAAAQTLYNERMCMSILWDREEILEDFIGEVLKHIDAVLYVSRRTGRFVLKLIREDADSNTIVLDEDSVISVANARRPTISELTNAVTVIYWDMGADVQESYTIHNEALRQVQGVEISATIQYPGFTKREIAATVALRDLKALSTPLLSCVISANRLAAELNIGDSFYLDWPDLNINTTLMRVQKIDYGDGVDNTVTIEALQDVFETPALVSQTAQGGLWTDPADATALAAAPRLVTEAPYFVVAETIGEWEAIQRIDIDNTDLGFLMVAAGRQANEFIAEGYTDAGAGYSKTFDLDFAPYATLDGDLDQVETELPILNGTDLDLVNANTLGQINEEIFQVTTVNQNSAGVYESVTVVRGVLDTVPQTHDSGSSLIFWGDFENGDGVEYVSGESIDVKLLPQVAQNQLALADAPVDSVTMASRAWRQFAPGNFRVDGLYYPQNYIYRGNHTLTWSYRERSLLNFGGVFGHAETGDVTAGGFNAEYIVQAVALIPNTSGDYDRVKFLDVNVGTAKTYTMNQDSVGLEDSNNADIPVGAEFVELSVGALDEGYHSWQRAALLLQAPPFTDSVGDSIGDSVAELDSVGFDSAGSDSVGPWTPDLASDLMLWLDAADTSTITEVSGEASVWADKSGNGNDADDSSTSARRPATGTVTQNGLNVLDFDGTANYLNAGNLGGKAASFTVYVVASPDNISKSTQAICAVSDATGAAWNVWAAVMLRSVRLNDYEAFIGNGVNDWQQVVTTDNPVTQGQFGIFGQTYQAGNTTISMISPDVARTTTSPSGGTNTNTPGTAYDFCVGNLGTMSAGNWFYDGKVAEVVIYDRVLTSEERDRLEGYLAHKWGLESQLNASHPYKTYPPPSDSVA